ncbi:FUSC family protein [Corynebacterium halotolerans]|uniref:FUSC family protein n=1 Tax=Corynebacterium halotolerans TaxID=225326 RepID=UPI003CF1AED9
MRRSILTTEVIQVLKSAFAATLAWWISVQVLDSALPFLAPWTALLTVHVTVTRSIKGGLQTLITSVIGVVLSFAIGVYLGVDLWTYALAMLVGMVASLLPWIRQEGAGIATTAIFLLSQGFNQDASLLIERVLEIGLGVVIGVVVNLLVLPPLRDRQAAGLVDELNARMGKILDTMGREFADSWDTDQAEHWTEEIEKMRRDLAGTWDAVNFARESRRRNPRRFLQRPVGESYEDILIRVDEGIAYLRNLARTLEGASYSDTRWDRDFREQWAATARDAGRRIAHPDADVEPITGRLDKLARDMAHAEELPDREWPLYGSLITSLRNISVGVDEVAAAWRDRAKKG